MALSAIAGMSAAAGFIVLWILWVQYRARLEVPVAPPALEATKFEEIKPTVADTAPVAPFVASDTAAPLVAAKSKPSDSAPLGVPGRDKIQEEIAENPHQTPVSLLQYAENIALKIEEATNDPEKAKALFTELENCVSDNSSRSAPSLQALCLANADELALTHPELQGRYQELLKVAPSDARKLLEAADQAGAPTAAGGSPFEGE
jgi:hypothetical protein